MGKVGLKLVVFSILQWSLSDGTAVKFEACTGGTGGAGNANETVKKNLKFVLSDVATQEHCTAQSPKVTDEKMLDRCKAFCSPGIPFTVGSTLAGFNLATANQICSDPIKNDVSMVSDCSSWESGMFEVNSAAADFVASLRLLTYQQLKYRAAMLDKVDELTKNIQDPSTSQKVKATNDINKRMSTFKEIVNLNLKDVMTSGNLQKAVTGQLETVEQKAELLESMLKKHLGNLEKFAENCNDLFLGTGANNEYLMDICSHSGTSCIEGQHGRHVSCCCGVVPAAGMFSISAMTGNQRRLNQPAQKVTDVCAKGYQDSSKLVEEVTQEILKFPRGAQILNQHLGIQKGQYADFYASCDRRLQEKDIPPSQFDMQFRHNGTEFSRKLQQNFLTCQKPTKPSRTLEGKQQLKVAFTATTQKDICRDQGLTVSKLADDCNKFCAAKNDESPNIPFLVGSPELGFSQKEMDEICLQPADTLYSSEFVSNCQKKGTKFKNIQAATASFISSLDTLEAAKLQFRAELSKKTEEFATRMKQEEEELKKNYIPEEFAVPYQEAIKKNVEGILLAGKAKKDLKDEAVHVKEKAQLLEKRLREILPDIRSFLQECNTLVTGVGPNNEYLLDMCPQLSKKCVEEDKSRHVGCCCGYNPITSLGVDLSTAATIKGATADSTWSRRLQATDDVPAGAINICGLARQYSKNKVNQYEGQVQAMDPALLAEAKAKNKEKYPAYNARCAEIKTVPAVSPVNPGNPVNPVKPVKETQASLAQQSYSQSVAAAFLMVGFHLS